jgi:triosephosphate isomerase
MSGRTFLAANWKMHLYPGEAEMLLQQLRLLEAEKGAWPFPVVVCPAHVYLSLAVERLSGTSLQVGAQNGYPGEFGAYTGEVSMAQLRAVGCTHVIVGHSERRQYFGEKGAFLQKKVQDAQARSLKVIYCIGETRAEREAGETFAILEGQLREALSGVDVAWDKLIIAYEPVWAIGTGLNATPQQAQEAHGFIREWLRKAGAPAEAVPILYGGSVKPANAEELFAQPDVDGGLVGGASLIAADFWAIAAALQKAKGALT